VLRFDNVANGMAKPVRIADIICYHRAHVLAVDSDNTLYQWRPDMPLSTDSQKVAALRVAICQHETIPWRTCTLELTRPDLKESVMQTKALLREHREDRFNNLAAEFQE
jgi:hypothetical protein